MQRKQYQLNWQLFLTMLAIVILAFLATYPAFSGHYFTISDDGNIHLARLESIYQAFKNGHLPSLVNFIGLGHRGSAMNAMYPWITTLIYVIPRFIFQSPMMGLAIGFLIMNILTTANMYWLATRLSNNRLITWLAVIAYEFNSYHFQVMFARIALGEAFGYAFLPLIILGLYKIWCRERNGIIVLALGMSLVGNSHVLSLAMFSFFIFILELIRFFQRKLNWVEVRSIIYSALLTVILSIYSLYNLIDWTLHNNMVSPTPKIVGMDPLDSMNRLLSNDISETAYGAHMGIAVTFILIVLIARLLSHPTGKWQGWIIGAGSVWVLAQKWIPWGLLINTPVSVFQFAMRVLTIVALCTTIGLILYLNEAKWQSRLVTTFFALFIILIGTTGLFSYHFQTYSDHIWAQAHPHPSAKIRNDVQRSNKRYLTGKRYQFNVSATVPIDYLLKNNKKAKPISIQNANNFGFLSQENRKTADFDMSLAARFKFIKATDQAATFTFNQKKRTKVKLPVVGYHNVNYEVFVNHHRVPYTRNQGQLKVQLPAGKSTIMVSVANSARHGGLLLVSAISYLACLILLVFNPFSRYPLKPHHA